MTSDIEKIRLKIANKDLNFNEFEQEMIRNNADLLHDLINILEKDTSLLTKEIFDSLIEPSLYQDDYASLQDKLQLQQKIIEVIYPGLDLDNLCASYYEGINYETTNEFEIKCIDYLEQLIDSKINDLKQGDFVSLSTLSVLITKKRYDKLSQVDYKYRSDIYFRGFNILEEEEIQNLKDNYPFKKLGYPAALKDFVLDFPEEIPYLNLDTLKYCIKNCKYYGAKNFNLVVNCFLKKVETSEEFFEIVDYDELRKEVNSGKVRIDDERIIDSFLNNGEISIILSNPLKDKYQETIIRKIENGNEKLKKKLDDMYFLKDYPILFKYALKHDLIKKISYYGFTFKFALDDELVNLLTKFLKDNENITSRDLHDFSCSNIRSSIDGNGAKILKIMLDIDKLEVIDYFTLSDILTALVDNNAYIKPLEDKIILAIEKSIKLEENFVCYYLKYYEENNKLDDLLLKIDSCYNELKFMVTNKELKINERVINLYLDNGDIDIILSNPLKNEYQQIIVQKIENGNEKLKLKLEDMNVLKNYPILLKYALRHDLIKKLNFDFNFDLNDELIKLLATFIKNNKEKIKDYILKIGYVPDFLKDSQELFNEFIKEKKFNMAFKFSETLFTTEFIKTNKENIMAYILNENYVPEVLKENQELCNEFMKEKKFDMAFKFSETLFTAEFIKANKENIIAYILNKNYVPEVLKENQELFNEFIKGKKFDIAFKFSNSLLTFEVIKNNKENIIAYILNKNYVPEVLKENQELFNEFIKGKNFDMAFKFSETLFTAEFIKANKENIIAYILNKNYVPEALKENQEIFNYFIDNKKFLVLKMFDISLFTEEAISKISNAISNLKFGVTSSQVKANIKELLAKNDELFLSLNLDMLITNIPICHIEKLALYPDLQQSIIDLTNESQNILCSILNFLENTDYDICPIIYNVLNNIHDYDELLNDLKNRELSDEDLKMLITVLSNKNDLNIRSYSELTRYDDLVLKKHSLEIKKILEGKDLPNILDSIFKYKFGLSLEDAKFLDERYCSDITSIQNGKLPNVLKETLVEIHKILNINNQEQLKFILLTSSRLKDDFYSTILLESSIRGELAKQYSDTLYKLKDSDKLTSSNVSSVVYAALNNTLYHDKKPNIYVLHDDFNLQIHVLGAYRNWNRPQNFKEDWLRPKIVYHGICTSYIGNNEIANARQYHPAYGFSHYEPSSLLCAGPYDLGSDDAISQFASARKHPYKFLPPKEMIDKTRHTHNEMVLERRNTDFENNNFKRMPDYVIYFVDDINNLNNFDLKNNELFNETVQAALDQDLPIVIVDRLYYAKREKAKCNVLLEQFKNSLDTNILKELLTQIANNMVGCNYYDGQIGSAYHDEFDYTYLHDVIDEIITVINNQSLNTQVSIINALNIIIRNDDLLKDYAFINDKFNTLNAIITQAQIGNSNLDNTNNNINIGKYLVDYYRSASVEIKEQIKKDVQEIGFDYQMIYQKIVNGEYEREKKTL